MTSGKHETSAVTAIRDEAMPRIAIMVGQRDRLVGDQASGYFRETWSPVETALDI